MSYFLNAINVFNSDRPRRRRINKLRLARMGWRWMQRHPTAGSILLALVGLVILFAFLVWGWA